MKRKGIIASFGSVKSREEQAGWIIEQGGVVVLLLLLLLTHFIWYLWPESLTSYAYYSLLG